MKQRVFFLSALVLFLLSKIEVVGQTDSHTIGITIPAVTMLRIAPTASKNITMDFTAPSTAGDPIVAPTNQLHDFIKAVVATSTSKMDSKLLTKYLNSTDDAKIQAELIAKNDGKIDQQRKYFSLLSKDIATLIATCGSSKHLYQDYCPMYNEGRSGYWISEMKEIKNPYFGSEMMECGGMIKEIK